MITHFPDNPSLRVVNGTEPEPAIRLLVIDDDHNDQEFLLRHLRKAKISDHILFIDDGRLALKLLAQEDVQEKVFAVFLDLNLNGMSGLEILRTIRATPNLSRLPVIIISGSTDPEERAECQRLKATSFISKPISFQTFCMAIANVFHRPFEAATTEH
jgi:CheY-like chemotaxis protein